MFTSFHIFQLSSVINYPIIRRCLQLQRVNVYAAPLHGTYQIMRRPVPENFKNLTPLIYTD